MHLKPNQVAKLTETVEERVLPLLRKQEGFKDEVFFVNSDGTEAIGISLWDRKDNAETYSHKAYPQVLQALTDVLAAAPQVKTYEVISSTFHKIAAQLAV
ncbi:MAG: hypothetical protein ACXWNJ_17605 [Vulcanimicrobiaceae bacterium]